jgi:hypothetical protein
VLWCVRWFVGVVVCLFSKVKHASESENPTQIDATRMDTSPARFTVCPAVASHHLVERGEDDERVHGLGYSHPEVGRQVPASSGHHAAEHDPRGFDEAAAAAAAAGGGVGAGADGRESGARCYGKRRMGIVWCPLLSQSLSSTQRCFTGHDAKKKWSSSFSPSPPLSLFRDHYLGPGRSRSSGSFTSTRASTDVNCSSGPGLGLKHSPALHLPAVVPRPNQCRALAKASTSSCGVGGIKALVEHEPGLAPLQTTSLPHTSGGGPGDRARAVARAEVYR